MRKQFIYLSLAATLFCGACKKDNYEAPDAGISGNIVDALTGKNVPQQTLNGAKIRLFQTDFRNPEPINSAIKADGSYANTFIFSGNYKVVAEGPFFYKDTLNLNIKGNVQADLKVTPYMEVTCELVSKTSTSITVRVKANRTPNNTQKIARVAVVAGTTTGVDINNYYNVNGTSNGRVLENTEAIADAVVEAKTYEFTLANLKPGTSYYVRGAARTINNGNFYNYASMLQISTNP
ncbi:DUF3823 domain-containing protein [Pedobacter gandavensis]|uniref:DUF3823 domain-containing protein n=1 Tax=Pedobacter gandavensis TaxID=2679963 RepID=A0ABR6ESJ7_9SPHI|nr:DUF3823 domain-containing protein [Pedobacter gandavensis]MBB2148236.1 DUF3823 domain-containing protein [Pedobacter gandavensis]